MIMIELEALNWSFQLLFYIYDMISGMSRADVHKTYTLYLTNTKFMQSHKNLFYALPLTIIYRLRKPSQIWYYFIS